MSDETEVITEDPSSVGTYAILCGLADVDDDYRDDSNRSCPRQRELMSRPESEAYAAYCAKTRHKLRPDDAKRDE